MSFDDTLLISMNTRTFGSTRYDANVRTTVISRQIGEHGERLIIEQPSRLRDDINEDDSIVLDRDTQHALYLLLKNRFED